MQCYIKIQILTKKSKTKTKAIYGKYVWNWSVIFMSVQTVETLSSWQSLLPDCVSKGGHSICNCCDVLFFAKISKLENYETGIAFSQPWPNTRRQRALTFAFRVRNYFLWTVRMCNTRKCYFEETGIGILRSWAIFELELLWVEARA